MNTSSPSGDARARFYAFVLLLGLVAHSGAAAAVPGVSAPEVAAHRDALAATRTDAENVGERLAFAARLLDALREGGEDVDVYRVVYGGRGRQERDRGDLAAYYRTCDRYFAALLRHYDTGAPELATPTGAAAAHPRLYWTTADLPRLRVPVDAVHQGMLAVNQVAVEALLHASPPPYASLVGGAGPDPWRTYGNRLIGLAFRARITRDADTLAAARRWLLGVCAYPRWGSGDDADHGLAAAHLLLGTAIAYDWLYDELPPPERATVRRKLGNQAAILHAYAAGHQAAWWRDTWTQNHNPITNGALALAGYATRGEILEAEAWIAQGRANAQRVMAALNGIGDGSYHEGVSYWSAMMTFLVLQLTAMEQQDGLDLATSSPWLRKTLAFRLYAQQPDFRTVVAFADGASFDYHGPEHVLRWLDARFRTGHGEWLARRIAEARGPAHHERRAWVPFEYLWYDPTVGPTPPIGLPPDRLFPDLGLLVLRSGWDGDATVLTLKSGLPAGRSRFLALLARRPGAGTVNAGHDHPNQNAVTLFGAGAQLLSAPGYPRPKRTRHHNTVLIDGAGQLGEGGTWFDLAAAYAHRAGGKVRTVAATPDYAFAVAEAGTAYPPAAGVERFDRAVLFLKPRVAIVIDQVELASPRPVRVGWHRYGQPFAGRGAATRTRTPEGATFWLAALGRPHASFQYGVESVAPNAPPLHSAFVDLEPGSTRVRQAWLLTVRRTPDAEPATGTVMADTGGHLELTVRDGAEEYTALLTVGDEDAAAEDRALRGAAGVIRVDRRGDVRGYFLADGTSLRQPGTGHVLVHRERGPATLQVRLAGDSAEVTTPAAGEVALYAPAAAVVRANDIPTPFVRDGDHIRVSVPAGTPPARP